MTLSEFLKSRGVPFRDSGHHHVTSGWLQVDCPDCGRNSQGFHLGLREDGKGANCWRCGPKRVGDALAALTGLPLREVLLLGKSFVGGPRATPTEIRGTLRLPKGLNPMLPRHRAYLAGRGYDPDEIETLWGVQGIGLASRLAWRLFIPVRAKDGTTVSWTTRAVSPSAKVRYLSAKPEDEAVSVRKVLYGAELARGAVAVMEGPTDVWRVGPGAVATLGVGYSKAQLRLIAGYPVRYVVFNNEPAAQARASKLCDDLEALPGVTGNVILSGNDAATSPDSEIRQLRRLIADG